MENELEVKLEQIRQRVQSGSAADYADMVADIVFLLSVLESAQKAIQVLSAHKNVRKGDWE